MLYKDLLVSELYCSMRADDIEALFKKGLKDGNDRVAGSAMEELIRRGDTDKIMYGLDEALKSKSLQPETPIYNMIARSLIESCREADFVLCHFGEAMRDKSGVEDGFIGWIRSGAAKKYLPPKEDYDSQSDEKWLKRYFKAAAYAYYKSLTPSQRQKMRNKGIGIIFRGMSEEMIADLKSGAEPEQLPPECVVKYLSDGERIFAIPVPKDEI